MKRVPIIGVMLGDPAGIGPEVSVRAVADPSLANLCTPMLIGDFSVVRRAAELCHTNAQFKAIDDPDHRLPPGTIGVLDPGGFDVAASPYGQASAASGHAVLSWIAHGEQLGRVGKLHGLVLGPVDSASLKATGKVHDIDELQPPGTFMLRISGNLRAVPLTEHVTLIDAIAQATPERIFDAISAVDAALRQWGFPQPRIAVAAINPHAMFPQDLERVGPAVERARSQGIDAHGPLVPDAVFRQCIQGQWDVVVTMFHDQGQIAIKTAGFEGACTVYIGLPFVMLNVPHGTAFDIAGRGTAQHLSMLSAIRTAGLLAAGRPLATASSSSVP